MLTNPLSLMTFVLASQFHVFLPWVNVCYANLRLSFVSSSNPQAEHVPRLPGAAHLPPPRPGVRGPGRGRGVQGPPPPRHPRPRHQPPRGGVLAEAGAAHTGGDQHGQLHRLFCYTLQTVNNHLHSLHWDHQLGCNIFYFDI